MSQGWTVGYGARQALGTVIPPTPNTIPANHMVGLSSSRLGLSASETHKATAARDRWDEIATQLGITGAAARLAGGRHAYDQSTTPQSAMSSINAAQNCVDDGYGHVLLTSSTWTDMAGLAAGTYTSTIVSMWQSKPASMHLVHNVFHEPQNNGWNATQQSQWRQMTARFAKAAYDLNDPKIYYTVCYIPGTTAEAWNWIPELQALDPTNAAAIAKRTFLGLDPYPEVGSDNAGNPVLQTLEQKCRQAINFFRSRGQTGPLFLPEVAFFNWRIATASPYTLTAAQQAQRMHDELWTWGQANGLVGYFYYDVTDSTPGDRSLTRILENPEELLEMGKLARGDYYT